jgi:spermidine synthase
LQKQPLHKRLLSYLYPVPIRKDSSTENPVLELFLYRNQYQLATHDALYSDGNRYKPIKQAVKKLKRNIAGIKNVLILGSGLGSACQILHSNGINPTYTLVDIDEKVLSWALEHLSSEITSGVHPVCMDACEYVSTIQESYNMVIVDIFNSRVVPGFVADEVFLKNIRRILLPGGCLILNYIVNDESDWLRLTENLSHIFPSFKVDEMSINRIITAKV